MVTRPRQANPNRPDVISFYLSLFPDAIIHVYVFLGSLFSGGASGYLQRSPLPAACRSAFSGHDLF